MASGSTAMLRGPQNHAPPTYFMLGQRGAFSATRCSSTAACWSAVLTGTKRIVGRATASGGGVLLVATRPAEHVLASPRPVVTEAAGRALAYPRSIRKRKQCVDMALRWELIALSLLAAIGLGLALGRGDLIFVAVFGAACAMAIIGGMQRFP
jgi:hypothetical protein